MWTNLRKEIEAMRSKFLFTDSQFKPVGLNDWQIIENNIIKTFCKSKYYKSQPVQLWEYFKSDSYSIKIERPTDFLEKLMDGNETIFFFINDTINGGNKFWFYTGQIKSIQTIIDEAYYIDELYFASKKYDWLICINHHDFLIATGQTMPDRLRALTSKKSN